MKAKTIIIGVSSLVAGLLVLKLIRVVTAKTADAGASEEDSNTNSKSTLQEAQGKEEETPKKADGTKGKLQTINVKITDIRNTKGNLVLCFFENQEDYKNEKESIRQEYPKADIKNGALDVSLDLAEGIYGAVILDDENLNGKMDYGIMLPKEGFGFSNFFAKLSKPKFDDFKFEIPLAGEAPIVIKMKYM